MATTNKVYFIAGGNRGIGLSLVKELSSREGTTVFASARKPEAATELQEWSKSHPNVKTVELDVTSQQSANEAAQSVAKAVDGIDVLWLNSGICQSYYTVMEAPEEVWNAHYQTNVLGPIHVFKAFYPLLTKKKTRQVIFTSSECGSMGDFRATGFSAYGQSKAAINFTMKELSVELADEHFTFISIHPGVVKTDMNADAIKKFTETSPEMLTYLKKVTIIPEESVSSMLKVVDNLKPENNGSFYRYDGTIIPF
ncbi:short chain dehydrogenase, unknown specificity [Schizosaccharomyces pombe]|uniref:Uncharacterized oxidoreductase C663.09c n=1 Tax=Schizosaccharomyces pombe (strain 972 / ATCC 24843) TaxID=284812 RepID=YCP9_SCHPO|nr:putative dehydrogenase [Schizosaccharomyces pombe]Q7Z9I2.1 RecName: Full=Uncharacterized oxidoreductase C663.09c [Schizosaccharomyces pombe 972h-]CAA20369.1 short chain dehydrogenase (predicted) [Schizosaccharomyces pombe]|eukprot:NP_588270.1 putative dehydrogenase [Schizosaccharomyces pombe]